MLDKLKKQIALLSASAAAIRRELSYADNKWRKAELLASLTAVLEAENALIFVKIDYLRSKLDSAEMSARHAAVEAAFIIERIRARRC